MSFDRDNPNPHSEDPGERRLAREQQMQLSSEIQRSSGNQGDGSSSTGCALIVVGAFLASSIATAGLAVLLTCQLLSNC